jgi:hypothetical protein
MDLAAKKFVTVAMWASFRSFGTSAKNAAQQLESRITCTCTRETGIALRKEMMIGHPFSKDLHTLNISLCRSLTFVIFAQHCPVCNEHTHWRIMPEHVPKITEYPCERERWLENFEGHRVQGPLPLLILQGLDKWVRLIAGVIQVLGEYMERRTLYVSARSACTHAPTRTRARIHIHTYETSTQRLAHRMVHYTYIYIIIIIVCIIMCVCV